MEFETILEEYPDATLIKKGGQKAAYRIDHPEYGAAALKIGEYTGPRSLERVRREVAILEDLDSDFFPKNFEFNVVEQENRFLILEEWIESTPLSAAWGRFSSPLEKLGFIRQLTEALSILWDRDIVHRDVKPENVLVKPNKDPVVIDLGIARLLDMESLTLTLAQMGPCTPFYAAPEQLTNRKTEIDWRADQFNLGILTTQFFLNGNHPFNPETVGEGESTVRNLLDGRWSSGPLENNRLSPVAEMSQKMLGKEPYMRFRKPDHFVKALERCMGSYR